MAATPRPAFAGFAGALASVLGGRVVALDVETLRAPTPPATCPLCSFPALHPSRDPNGEWTWDCPEGCNP